MTTRTFEKINDIFQCKLILENGSEFTIPLREAPCISKLPMLTPAVEFPIFTTAVLPTPSPMWMSAVLAVFVPKFKAPDVCSLPMLRSELAWTSP